MNMVSLSNWTSFPGWKRLHLAGLTQIDSEMFLKWEAESYDHFFGRPDARFDWMLQGSNITVTTNL